MSFECEFCGNKFTSKQNLATHKKRAKYCLNLRRGGEKDSNCPGCGKVYVLAHSLKTHISKCPDVINAAHEKMIAELRENHALEMKVASEKSEKETIREMEKHADDVAVLEDTIRSLRADLAKANRKIRRLEMDNSHNTGRIEGIKEAPKVSVSNNNSSNLSTVTINPKLTKVPIDNIRPLTIETVREDLHKYDYETFMSGPAGLVSFIKNMITYQPGDGGEIERNYACTDTARHKYHRLVDKPGEGGAITDDLWKTDSGARFMHEIFNELRPTVKDYHVRLIQQAHNAPDRDEEDAYDAIRDRLRPMINGISSSGEERDALFNEIRVSVRGLTAV